MREERFPTLLSILCESFYFKLYHGTNINWSCFYMSPLTPDVGYRRSDHGLSLTPLIKLDDVLYIHTYIQSTVFGTNNVT